MLGDKHTSIALVQQLSKSGGCTSSSSKLCGNYMWEHAKSSLSLCECFLQPTCFLCSQCFAVIVL